jgi:perosamine synthetase
VQAAEPLLADDAEHRRSWFVYPVGLDPAVDREHVIAALDADGIQTSRYLPSIHLQPYMRERFGFTEGMCPVSEEASRRLLSLPFHSRIAPADQERVIEALARAL